MMIGGLEEFIHAIQALPPCEKGYVRYYRGQPVDKPLVPNVFREKNFIDYESEIYHEIVNKKPEEFASSRCTFDYLVKMQHYSIPTRLLDITSNPLIAFYFACSSDGDAPTVYPIDIPIGRIKNYTSDSVTILASLARYDEDSKEELLGNISNLNQIRTIYTDAFMKEDIKNIEELLDLIATHNGIVYNDILSSKESFKRIIEHIVGTVSFSFDPQKNNYLRNEGKIRKIIRNTLLNIVRKRLLHSFSTFSVTRELIINSLAEELHHIDNLRLLHEVRQDKPYFLDLMHIDTFNTIYCVKPRLDNPRIIKQNGSFLIFPHQGARLEEDETVKINKITIDKTKTDTIIKELSTVDINEESLFSDMDTVSKSIKEQFRNKESKPNII